MLNSELFSIYVEFWKHKNVQNVIDTLVVYLADKIMLQLDSTFLIFNNF